jgi:hypothetical protein
MYGSHTAHFLDAIPPAFQGKPAFQLTLLPSRQLLIPSPIFSSMPNLLSSWMIVEQQIDIAPSFSRIFGEMSFFYSRIYANYQN